MFLRSSQLHLHRLRLVQRSQYSNRFSPNFSPATWATQASFSTANSKVSSSSGQQSNYNKFAILGGGCTFLSLAIGSKIAMADSETVPAPENKAEKNEVQTEQKEAADANSIKGVVGTAENAADANNAKKENAGPFEVDEEVFEKVSGFEAVLDLMNNMRNKFIYMRHGTEEKHYVDQVDELGALLASMEKIGTKPYQIDLGDPQTQAALIEYLRARGSTFNENTIMQSQFILGNKFNDLWFQENNLVSHFQRELPYFYKYFEGPRVLPNINHLLCAQSHHNDLHLVSYIGDMGDVEQLKRTKQFRKLSQTNQNEVFHYQYWYVSDKALAESMGIKTDEESIGDLYLLRKSSPYTQGLTPNINLEGYDFISEPILTSSEMQGPPETIHSKILQFAFNSPIVVNDHRAFFTLANMFKAQLFVIYCDKKNPKVSEQVLKAAIKANKEFPIVLKTGPDGEYEVNKTRDILFVISTCSNLMFYQFSEEIDGPQALLMPFGETFNAMEKMLPKLKVFDELPLKEWIQKANKAHEVFAPQPGDSQKDIEKKESQKRWYALQRFELEKKYYTSDFAVLGDGHRLGQYIKDIRSGKVPLYFESANLPPAPGPMIKLCGNNFNQFMTKSNLGQSKLVLVTHRDPKKNFGILEQFERFVKKEEKMLKAKGKGGGTIPCVYSGLNESDDYKVPDKLPTFVLFKRGAALTEGPTEIDHQDLLKSFISRDSEKAIDNQKFDKVLKDFLKKNLKS